MSFVGKLDQFHLTDLLQIIATNQKSGKLSLTKRDAQGVIVFRNGQIIYAASSSARETLGFLLLSEQLVTERELLEALEDQHQANEEKRLGTILIERGALRAEDLTRLLKNQAKKVLSEFLEWRTGFFKFERLDIPDHGEVAVDAEDFLLREGLRPDQVLVDLSEKIEALEKSPSVSDPAASGQDSISANLASLRSIMLEIRSPEFTGEATLKLLDFARNLFQRGVLFSVGRHNFTAMNHFGVEALQGMEIGRLAKIKIPLDQPSVLSESAESKATFVGALEPVEWNLYLMSQLGGNTPSGVVALPLIVNGRVLLVLYADNAVDEQPLGSVAELELLALQMGLAMEKKLLEKRIEQFKKLRDA